MNVTVRKPKTCYRSDKRIINYMKDRTELNKLLKGKPLHRFSNKETKFYNNVRQRKIRVLEKVIFPSMANLVVFFEELKDPQLRNDFEDDIKELFGYIGNYQLEKGKSGYQNIMVRFMESLLFLDIDKKDYSDDFRLGLIGDIQNILYYKIRYLAIKEFVEGKKPAEADTEICDIINSHMRQAYAWARMYHHKYENTQFEKDKAKIPSKPVSF